jgi:chemotaxis protein CheY-P-specific phosphatase CheC
MIEIANILPDAITEALETMAFMVPVSLEEELPVPERSIAGQISFSGPQSGTLQIIAGVEFAKNLAENIAALEDPDDDACIDAMQELSNVTCGLILPGLASSESDLFDMTIPKTQWLDGEENWNNFIEDGTAQILNIEEHLVAAKLTIEG